MTRKEKAVLAVSQLEKEYPTAHCTLEYNQPYRLLVAVRLSAQCTDARVDLTTPILFERYPSLESLANAKFIDIEEIIKPCGLYKTKAKDLIEMSRKLINEFQGKVPDNIEDLLKLPGIGRKSANLIVGDIYGKPAVVTDTHCIRLSNRIGLTSSDIPLKVEMQLKEILPPEKSNDFCHRLVWHGRKVCTARKPKCEECCLSNLCSFAELQS